MSGAKPQPQPPERVTLHWYGMAGILQDSNREVDNPVEYVRADVAEATVLRVQDIADRKLAAAEKRERALRSALTKIRDGVPAYDDMRSIARRALVRCALAAADEGEKKR